MEKNAQNSVSRARPARSTCWSSFPRRCGLLLFIDEQGNVQSTVLVESSSFDALDEAAIEVAKHMVWSPALNRDRATPVWLMKSIDSSRSAVGDRSGAIRLP